jgi:DNA polymerase-3 subunit gamma/tau
MLRAVLMTQTGARAEGLTAAARDAVTESTERLVPGDVLRMLSLLADAETAIRRSANGRLVVETLLLRWVLMDRTVDLEAVLAGAPLAPATGQAAARPFVDREHAGPRQSSTSAPRAGPAIVPTPGEAGPLPRLVDELTVEALIAAWPDVAARGRQASPLAGAVLDALAPAVVEGDTVRLRLLSDDGHMAEGARRHQKTIERVIGEAVGRAVRVEVDGAVSQVAANDRPKRLSAKDLREERLKELRGIDPALDAAADALDLEIVD